MAELTTRGLIYNPKRNILLALPDGPTSFPWPGTFNLSAHNSINFFLPQMYAPFVAMPAPKFLIRLPTTRSAPTSVGSL